MTWSGGYRTYLDNVRLRFEPCWLCFYRVEARSFGFGFGFYFFADNSVPGSTLNSLLCSCLLISFLSHVFHYYLSAGITGFLFSALDMCGRVRQVSSTCRRKICLFQSIVSICFCYKQVHEKMETYFSNTTPNTSSTSPASPLPVILARQSAAARKLSAATTMSISSSRG